MLFTECSLNSVPKKIEVTAVIDKTTLPNKNECRKIRSDLICWISEADRCVEEVGELLELEREILLRNRFDVELNHREQWDQTLLKKRIAIMSTTFTIFTSRYRQQNSPSVIGEKEKKKSHLINLLHIVPTLATRNFFSTWHQPG